MSNSPSALNALLRQQLLLAHELDQQISSENTSGTILDVPDTGKTVSSAYEQLRNAADYSEEHLLLQRAIKRFFKRNLFITKRQQHNLGSELITDLTQAGYLQDEQFSNTTTNTLGKLIKQYMATHQQLREASIAREAADSWVLALLSTDAENLLGPHNSWQGTLFAAYNHFLESMPRKPFANLPDYDEYELCLYIAVHLAILKSDIDIIRHDLHRLYRQSPEDTAGFIALSQQIDKLFGSQLTQALKRTVSRNGAPFRVLKSMSDDRPDTEALLSDKEQFMAAYAEQIDHEYMQLDRRLGRGLVRSVVFIIITKLLIGATIEVPYDLLVHGSVAVLPLVVNLFFPPLYMTILTLNIRLPSEANKQNIYKYTERLLYGQSAPQVRIPKRRRTTVGTRIAYTLLFIIPVVITVLVLQSIGFNAMQMIIFFVFFSTASFLGFRLSAMVRELQLSAPRTGLLGSLQEAFYLPFIASGQWLSRKYSRLNIVARFLDVAVELPLKSMLRLVQQWINFIREQREDMY